MPPPISSWVSRLTGGPDHFLELVFDRDPRALVRALDLRGFVRTELPDRAMRCELRGELACSGVDFYADAHHHAELLANMRGAERSNVWSYQAITVGAGRVWIEHGYGATDDETLAAEMKLLERACEPDAGLVSWSIEVGGQGYPGLVILAGGSGADLRVALQSPE